VPPSPENEGVGALKGEPGREGSEEEEVNAMGYLYRVGKTWYIGYQDHTGQWVRKSARTRYKAAAEAKLKQAELRAAKGEADRPPVSLKAFLEQYLGTQRPTITDKTFLRHRECLDNLTREGSPLAGLTLSDVTLGACSQYVSWRLAQGRAKRTVEREIGWLKQALTEAARQELISWETVARLREELTRKRLPALRHAQVRRERILWPKEVPLLFKAVSQNRNLRDALLVALFTGLRMGNILTLTEAQVDFTCDPPVLRFPPEQMKNRTGHLVKLPPIAAKVLWRRWYGDPDRRFFADFRPAWKRLQRRLQALLPGFRFHDLRRTYITYRLGAGIDPKTVQDEVGHLDSRMTMDCYGRALRDPGVRAWAMRFFRFPWDPTPQGSPIQLTHNSHLPSRSR